MKRWLYVVQQKLAITNTEASALFTISFLLVVGLIVGEVRSRIPLFSDATYAETDRLFLEGAHAAVGTVMVAAADTLRAVEDSTASAESSPESPKHEPAPKAAPSSSAMIDLNTASSSELQQLPRIGPALAARILEYRATYGPFHEIDELMEVSGIGEATLARLKPFLRIAPVQEEASEAEPRQP